MSELERAILADSDFSGHARGMMAGLSRPGSETQFSWDRNGRTYEVVISRMEGGTSEVYAFLFNDVTERMRFQETQELARRYLEDILNNIQLGVIVLSRDMRITNLNRAQERFLNRMGIRMSWVEVIGMEMAELMSEDAIWSQVAEQVLDQGEGFAGPQRTYQTEDGDLILSIEITPLRDPHGKVIGAIQVSEDVTEKVKLEGELHDAEIKAERLEAVRETAVAVNHEVNNPLASILGMTQLLLLSAEKLDEDTLRKLKQIEAGVNRIASVTSKLGSLDKLKTKDYISEGPKMLDLGLGE